jgi:hypothetical protein
VTAPYPDQSLPGPASTPIPPARGYVLRSEQAQWERRAAVAGDAAAELMNAYMQMASVLEGNYLGQCVEGQDTYRALRAAIANVSRDVRLHAQLASELAARCRSAGDDIERVDAAGAGSFES